MADAETWAAAWLARGFAPIPVPFGTKIPVLQAWQKLRLTAATLGEQFNGAPQNVGALLGDPSGGRVCVDLDAPEAVALAGRCLPQTGLVSGRPGNPGSHRFYVLEGAVPSTRRYDDPAARGGEGTKARLCELLSTGAQVIVEGQHPSGEPYRVEADGAPATVATDVLMARLGVLAAGALLARYWPARGRRHDAALALAGGLLRGGWAPDRAAAYVAAIARVAGDEESRARARDAVSTAARLADDQPATGWATLSQLLGEPGEPVVRQVRAWLQVEAPAVCPAALPVAEAPWPAPLAAAAYHGWLGEAVQAIAPYSEADPVALLVHLVTGVGALVGPHVYAIAGDARHPARLNAVCVGETSKGRKGSAERPVARLLGMADDTFIPERRAEGLSSGEGLIWQVRDPIYRNERVGKGQDQRTELVEVDPGVADKRLWLVESEFASVLRVIQREGNTLSAVVRRVWDDGDLRTLTKNSPAVATGAHIAIMGHVTKDELLRYLDRTELASGFANRFPWFAVRRARLLPDGGEVPAEGLVPLAHRLRAIVEWARTPRVLVRDAEARALWHEVYADLTAGQPGLFGAATNRAEAQVLRLSVLYAICDQAPAIQAPHLLAALAVWQHAEASARWIFGDATGDPTADMILAALRQDSPLTRNDVVNLFGRHVSGARLDQAFGLLLTAGRVERRTQPTGGRSAEVWYARGTAPPPSDGGA